MAIIIVSKIIMFFINFVITNYLYPLSWELLFIHSHKIYNSSDDRIHLSVWFAFFEVFPSSLEMYFVPQASTRVRLQRLGHTLSTRGAGIAWPPMPCSVLWVAWLAPPSGPWLIHQRLRLAGIRAISPSWPTGSQSHTSSQLPSSLGWSITKVSGWLLTRQYVCSADRIIKWDYVFLFMKIFIQEVEIYTTQIMPDLYYMSWKINDIK